MRQRIQRRFRQYTSILKAKLSTPSAHRRAYREAIKTGYFDLKWYQEHYGNFATEELAFQDYLQRGHYGNVNPSARFDSETYLRGSLDIYHGEINPLVHFLNFGRHEGRPSGPAQPRWLPKTSLVATDTQGWNKQSVALCLHIFYHDFVDKFARSLSNFPTSVDVFITCASPEIEQAAQHRFSKLANVKQVKTALAQNRGRNFGPFLVEFGKELLNYDLMCHLHSKKSLYSGREQTQWFDYLNQYLLKDRHVTSCLLRLFDEHKDLGIYYPTSFWMMPSWVNHWTCNKPFCSDFVQQWGLDLEGNFVNYPVGGMFWARPEALRPLLEKTFTYDDFPPEPLPNDGSWLHALERVLGLLAEKQGYEQFFYHPPTGQFTQDKSYVYNNYVKLPGTLFRELNRFDIVSFDIFDTVIRRQYCEPDYGKYLLGERLSSDGITPSPQAFLKLRNDTEYELRVKLQPGTDVSLEQVYERLAQKLGMDQEQGRELMEQEFLLDLEQIQPKDEMIEIIHLLANNGKKIWFISDTYYSHQHIERILRKVGVSVPHRLYVSSAMGLRKDSGTMWQWVKEKVEESGLSFIHVGDNVRSDAQICGDFGLTNMHILHPDDKWQAAGFPLIKKTEDLPDIRQVMKWGELKNHFGRYPFFGE